MLRSGQVFGLKRCDIPAHKIIKLFSGVFERLDQRIVKDGLRVICALLVLQIVADWLGFQYAGGPQPLGCRCTGGSEANHHADAAGIISFFSGATGQALVNGTLDTSAANYASASAAAGAGSSAGSSAGSAASSLKSNFTDAEWKWLLSQWAYTGNAEAVMSQVPLSDLKALVEEHNKGNI